jgi:exopolysaccharide biosynthesis polyprenyl glycosylphosphotransferase
LIAYLRQPTFQFAWKQLTSFQPGPFQASIIYLISTIISMQIMGLQQYDRDRRSFSVLLRVLSANALALGLLILFFYFFYLQQIGRIILITTLILSTLFIWGTRVFFWKFTKDKKQKIGYILPKKTEERLRFLISENYSAFVLVDVDDTFDKLCESQIASFYFNVGVDEVLVSLKENNQASWLACLKKGIQVTEASIFVEREFYTVLADDIDLRWLVTHDHIWLHPFYHRIKRGLDILFSVVALTISFPLLLIVALAILIEGGGPFFYSQMRTGFRNQPFRLWKIRTMKIDSEYKGAQWAVANDKRITTVGSLLRRTRIDELPQFWNVLRGEMSIIGPRPERPEFVEMLSDIIPMYSQRHWIKPGITGWAQINYPYGASVEDARKKLCYDLYYLKYASLGLDLHIALRTVGAMAKGSR